MKTIKKTYKVYNYNELSEDVKEKVIEKFASINVDYSGWQNEWYEDDYLHEIAKKYGLEIVLSEMCFDLGRGEFLYFETYNHGNKENYQKGIIITDHKKFMKKAGCDLRKVKHVQDYQLGIDHEHFGGGVGKNILKIDYNLDYLPEGYEDKLHQCLKDFIEEILDQVKKSYNYLTSREAIEDTIRANEFEFLKNGSQCLHI